MELPKAKTSRQLSFEEAIVYIYGESKAGKTLFTSKNANCIILDCEGGSQYLEAYRIEIRSWGDIMEAYKLLLKEKADYCPISIDPISRAYEMLIEQCCKEAHCKSPHLRLWGEINQRMLQMVTSFAALKHGLWLIDHSRNEIEEGAEDIKDYEKSRGIIGDTLRRKIQGKCNVIGYLHLKTIRDGEKIGQQRVLELASSPYFEAGVWGINLPPQIFLTDVGDHSDLDKFLSYFGKNEVIK